MGEVIVWFLMGCLLLGVICFVVLAIVYERGQPQPWGHVIPPPPPRKREEPHGDN